MPPSGLASCSASAARTSSASSGAAVHVEAFARRAGGTMSLLYRKTGAGSRARARGVGPALEGLENFRENPVSATRSASSSARMAARSVTRSGIASSLAVRSALVRRAIASSRSASFEGSTFGPKSGPNPSDDPPDLRGSRRSTSRDRSGPPIFSNDSAMYPTESDVPQGLGLFRFCGVRGRARPEAREVAAALAVTAVRLESSVEPPGSGNASATAS